MQPDQARVFVTAHTTVQTPPLCPEIRLHLADDMIPVWEALEAMRDAGASPPYWSVAWVGGQALARYVLDHRHVVAGKDVLDVGSGCGLGAIAAVKAGATRVRACETDVLARTAIAMNASLNGVAIPTNDVDVFSVASLECDVVLAGDLWYERLLAERATAWLRQRATAGCNVLLGDMGRNYFPRQGVVELMRYSVATPPNIERAAVTPSMVWRMLPVAGGD